MVVGRREKGLRVLLPQFADAGLAALCGDVYKFDYPTI
jgi:hypothetical protein